MLIGDGGGDDPCYSCNPGGGDGGGGYGGNAVAMLACSSAARGGTVTCTVSPNPPTASLQVRGWRFQGGGFGVTGTTTATSWSGTGVVSGTVYADVTLNGSPVTASTALSISNRSWTWGPGNWNIVPGGLAGSCFAPYGQEFFPGLTANENCQPIFVLPVAMPGSGHTIAQGTGPNQGIWYVSGVSFRVDARSALHPATLPGGPAWASSDAAQAQACRTALGLPPSDPGAVSMYTFNDRCIPTPDYFTWLSYSDAHEQHHLDLIGQAASQNDLYAAVEALTQADSTALHTEVREAWNRAARAILDLTRTIDNPYVTIWTGNVYLWYTAGRYFSLNQVRGYR